MLRQQTIFNLILAGVLAMILASCATVPITGRSQLNLVSEDVLVQASSQQYNEFMRSHRVITGGSARAAVNTVGRRIAAAVEQFLLNNGRAGEAASYRWEFNLIASDEVNAFAMPGGKVAVYSGMLPVTRNEAGLAVVIGHEIAHVVARHGSERMSQQLIAQMGGQALSSVLATRPEATQSLWMRVYGMGATLGVMLPYSRIQETEADQLGMIFMAMAGYDPRNAAAVWQRMAGMQGRQRLPEMLSTHPADRSRIRNIEEFMPTALKYYRPIRW